MRALRFLDGAVAALVAVLISSSASAATIYVDGKLGADCASTYDATSRTCGGGSATAFRTLAAGAAAAVAGSIVLIRAGSYSEPLVPTHSGSAAQVVVFRAQTGETVTLTGISDPALQIKSVSYVTVEGLAITNVLGWGRIESAQNIVIRACKLSQATATGTTGGLKFVKSSYVRVVQCSLDDGNDNLVVQESDRNLIEGNTFTKGRHSLLSVRCGNYNVIRGNRFDNPDQKAAEIYDCEGTSDAPIKLDATKRNVIEGNEFARTKASAKSYDYNGIQYAGQDGIVRRNVFHDNLGGGLGIQVYADEALSNYGHRIYNNTFVANACFGISASSAATSTQYRDNLVLGNILYKNTGCSGEATQTSIGNTTAVVLQSNALPASAPGFVNEAARDLHLTAASPLLDTGAFVTRSAGAGSGTQLVVDDASYFYDGNGIPGEQGDLVQLEGQTATARLTAVDVAKKTLTLATPLTWTAGQRLHLAYAGKAPEPGAYELGLTPPPPGDGKLPGLDRRGDGPRSGDGAPGDGARRECGGAGGDGARTTDGCGCAIGDEGASLGGLSLLLAVALVIRTARHRSRRLPGGAGE